MLKVDLYNNTYNTTLVTGDEYLDLVANADGASGNRYRIDLYILQLNGVMQFTSSSLLSVCAKS